VEDLEDGTYFHKNVFTLCNSPVGAKSSNISRRLFDDVAMASTAEENKLDNVFY